MGFMWYMCADVTWALEKPHMVSCCCGIEVPTRSGDLIQHVGTAPVQVSWLPYLDSQHLCIQGLPTCCCPRLYFTVTLLAQEPQRGQSSHVPGVRNGGSVSWVFTLISSLGLLLTQLSAPWTSVKPCDLLFLGLCSKAGCALRGCLQPLCSQQAAELFDQHKLWQSGVINFPQPTTWNSWKDGLSLFLVALAGLNCPLHSPAAAQEGCMPQATALLPWASDLNSVSSVR